MTVMAILSIVLLLTSGAIRLFDNEKPKRILVMPDVGAIVCALLAIAFAVAESGGG